MWLNNRKPSLKSPWIDSINIPKWLVYYCFQHIIYPNLNCYRVNIYLCWFQASKTTEQPFWMRMRSLLSHQSLKKHKVTTILENGSKLSKIIPKLLHKVSGLLWIPKLKPYITRKRLWSVNLRILYPPQAMMICSVIYLDDILRIAISISLISMELTRILKCVATLVPYVWPYFWGISPEI